MATVEKISVALTSEMVATLRAAVATGEYASASEVMREAMRDWTLRRVQRTRAMEQLGQLWDEGMDSPSLDGEEAFAAIRTRIAATMASPRT